MRTYVASPNDVSIVVIKCRGETSPKTSTWVTSGLVLSSGPSMRLPQLQGITFRVAELRKATERIVLRIDFNLYPLVM